MTFDKPDTISRRRILERAGLLGTALAVGLPETALGTTSNSPPPQQLKVIVAGGHPGDPEYGCGGTVARYADLGHDVVLLYLNNGLRRNPPPPAPAPDRVAEAAKACGILKARPLYAGQIDGEAIVDAEHSDRFRALLEAERPHLVFTHWPIDNHADHRAISMLVYDAWLHM